VSKKRSVCSRRDDTTGGPMLRWGTKWPSMTSRCSQSVPGATRPTAWDSLPKSAESIDGATRSAWSGIWVVVVVGFAITDEPTGGTSRSRWPHPRRVLPFGGEPIRSLPQGVTWPGPPAVEPVQCRHRALALGLHRDQPEPCPVAGDHLAPVEAPGGGAGSLGHRVSAGGSRVRRAGGLQDAQPTTAERGPGPAQPDHPAEVTRRLPPVELELGRPDLLGVRRRSGLVPGRRQPGLSVPEMLHQEAAPDLHQAGPQRVRRLLMADGRRRLGVDPPRVEAGLHGHQADARLGVALEDGPLHP